MFGRKAQPASADSRGLVVSEQATGRHSNAISHAHQQGQAVGSAVPDRSFSVLEGVNGDGVVLVGKGTTIHGEIGDCSKVEVQGRLEGSLIADIVVIREGGSISGKLQASRVEVHGVIDGEIHVADLLDIKGTGEVVGDLSYGRLSVVAGARISGTLQAQDASQPSPSGMYEPSSAASDVPPTPPGYLNGSGYPNGHAQPEIASTDAS